MSSSWEIELVAKVGSSCNENEENLKKNDNLPKKRQVFILTIVAKP
jgi:hypothetical protein